MQDQQFKIPHGEDKVQVELTVKELIALSGTRFNHKPQTLLDARKKLRSTLEQRTQSKEVH